MGVVVTPVDGDAELYQTPVSFIQRGVEVDGERGSDGSISGTLVYVDWGPLWAYYESGGHYLCLDFDSADEDADVYVGVTPSDTDLVKLGDDMRAVLRVDDKTTQVLTVRTVKGDDVLEQVYDLSGLVAENPKRVVVKPEIVHLGDEPGEEIYFDVYSRSGEKMTITSRDIQYNRDLFSPIADGDGNIIGVRTLTATTSLAYVSFSTRVPETGGREYTYMYCGRNLTTDLEITPAAQQSDSVQPFMTVALTRDGVAIEELPNFIYADSFNLSSPDLGLELRTEDNQSFEWRPSVFQCEGRAYPYVVCLEEGDRPERVSIGGAMAILDAQPPEEP